MVFISSNSSSNDMADEKVIRVGSRKSELALIQTKHVIARLQKLQPSTKFEIHTMSTIGDRVLNISLPKIGEKSLFTRDLEDALRNGGVDFVVHSLKDLPTALPPGMAVGAVLEREDARDALVLRADCQQYSMATLPAGSVIGTSSLRRTAQIRRQYPQLSVCDIRGNLNTRLAKLDADESKYAGIILAQAGLVRMGWTKRISQVLEPTELLYAVGQGALAVECRANDNEILSMLQQLMCLPTTCRILAERSFLKTLGGGCSAPVAVWSTLKGADGSAGGDTNNAKCQETGLLLSGAVWSLDGATEIRGRKTCTLALPFIEMSAKKRGAGRDTLRPTSRKLQEAVAKEQNSNDTDEQPPCKRARSNASSSPELQRGSPPVINDDADVEELTGSYSMKELIDKHIDLAKKCPVVGAHGQNDCANNNNGRNGGGDAPNAIAHCPLPIDVGQDVMGECPFVSNEAKVALAKAGQCPLTAAVPAASSNGNNGEIAAIATADVADHAAKPSTSSLCPFSGMHAQNGGLADFAKASTHGKCPFLQKTVQMFDYADEEKPTPQLVSTLSSRDDDLFCGLYRHACCKRELFAKSDALGKELADELIGSGALDVMKLAQAEIHSKA